MNNTYTQLILKTGLILGLILFGTEILAYLFPSASMGILAWILRTGAIVWALLYYGKQAAAIKNIDNIGYTYGQAFGFSILVLLLAGLLAGIGSMLMQTVIDPAYYDSYYDAMLQQLANSPAASDLIDQQIEMIDVMRRPLTIVLARIISVVIGGGLIALLTSTSVKQEPRL